MHAALLVIGRHIWRGFIFGLLVGGPILTIIILRDLL